VATYSQQILVDNVFYFYKKELGRGTFGVVYLYESKDGKKIVIKIFDALISRFTAMKEKRIQRDLWYMGLSRMPKQLDYPSMLSLVSEFAEYSIEEYLNIRGIHNKLSFTDMLVQMVDAV
jgi:hypothetical protein